MTTKHAAQAAWLTAPKTSLEVSSATYTPPGENEIVVRNRAVAVNPVDWFKRDVGNVMFKWIKYPFVMGSDTAGEIVEIGANVTRFAVGDRVLGHAVGMDHRSNKSSEGAFQTFTVLRPAVTSHIPSTMSFEEACVLPLALSTAASALFMKDFLALKPPTSGLRPSLNETILIWGASSSVGCNAVQLASAAGYEVFATASPKNHDLLRSLGAAKTWDYKSATTVDDIVAALKGKTTAGALAIGTGSVSACIDVIGRSKGHKFIVQASVDLPANGFPMSKSIVAWSSFGATMGYNILSSKAKSIRRGVKVKFPWGSDPAWNEIGRMIYEDFLPHALQEQTFKPAPAPLVVGHGLENVQQGLETSRKGVSAQKVVITL